MEELVRAFFKAYERANSTSDFKAIGDLYAETFLFAGQNAAQSVRRADFLKVIPRMKDNFASLGLTGTCLSTVETTGLGSRHMLAKVGWVMSLRTAKGAIKKVDAFATYVLQRSGDDNLSILFQLDHQDLGAMLSQERGTNPSA